MARLTTGAAIVQTLIRHGVDTIFGLPGAQTYDLFEALHEARGGIRLITVRHEQAAAYMAFGYARSTGRVGVYTVVPGPGVLNTMAALCTAVGCTVPVLCITGQIPTPFIGKGRGHLHELPDQLATLRSLLKWAQRIDRPAAAPGVIEEAFRQMRSGRPGPVAVETPWDVMGQVGDVAIPGAIAAPAAAPADEEAIDAAADLIAAARRPMIYAGGGALDAGAEVTALAEKLGAPAFAFRGGRGVVGDDHPLGLTLPAAHELWPETDLLIGIGSRIEGPYMRWQQMKWVERPPTPKLVRIDIDPAEMDRLPADAAVVGDAKIATGSLLAALRRRAIAAEDRAGHIAAVKARTLVAIDGIQPQVAYLKVIREALPRDGFFVEELCQVGFASNYAYPVYVPRTYVTCGYQGTLGFGFPTALGVKVGNPGKAVVSVTGDGGFMFAMQELATAVHHGIGLVTILFNNQGFENVRRDQQARYQGHVIGAEWSNPDFAALARSFGVAAYHTDNPEGLGGHLKHALAADAPALIEVAIAPGSEVSPWQFIHQTAPQGR